MEKLLSKIFRGSFYKYNTGGYECWGCGEDCRDRRAKYIALNKNNPTFVVGWCGDDNCYYIGGWIKLADISEVEEFGEIIPCHSRNP